MRTISKMKTVMATSLVVVSILFYACNDDFLDTTPLDKISSSATWSDATLSEAFVFSIYSYLGFGGFEEQMQAVITDEALFTHAGRNINTFNEGSESPSNLAWTSGTYSWRNMYSAIRQANLAISNLPEATFDSQTMKDQLMGEAHFLRAYYYQQLMRFYGGVPLIDKPYTLEDELSIARNTFEETVNFIVADLDKAASLLNGKSLAQGRASKIAAMALKSRVLLYAASDLHESSKAPSGYGTALHAYSGGQQARWQAAQQAAKAVLDMTSGYKTDLTAPVAYEEGKANALAIAMGGKSSVADAAAASELIFMRTLSSDYKPEDNWPLGGTHFGVNNGPNGYHNWSGNPPIQQMVDDYELMDGSKFDWTNATHKADPYADRDPRLYVHVLYDGAKWKPRPSDVVSIDPYDEIQTGYYDDGSGGLINGVDTRESPIENWNGSRTHYNLRKWIDPDPSIKENLTSHQVIPWPFIRYAEVVLNYVEASINLGQEEEARNWMNKTRFRVGMPAVTETGGALLAKYINERRVELAFEEHRYHDARRWLIASETLGRGVKVINITAKLKAGKSPHVPYRHDKAVYDYTYDVQGDTSIENRTWKDKMYYRPIGRDEMNKNDLLVQNPGY
ncbi:MAG: RagB/SusD family nutrient uptake outer membrane protein [Flavobacteriaceae bacterium]|nr:RagB/SusD family nutrient uptake outer membrane protein [Flavobacteriaceae bacterium]MDG2386440.1 RagB/SusD family nutrient uptake outer membrane protein [Flavobacteriaceae bacterium]